MRMLASQLNGLSYQCTAARWRACNRLSRRAASVKVLVVGASGFIGRALVDRLLAEGCTVDAWDRRGGPTAPRLRRWAVDLLADPQLPAPDGAPWDVAFHLAAHSLPGMAWSRGLILDNLTMTARVIEHLSNHAAGCLTIVASSAQVYAVGDEPLTEASPVGPIHPYGLSKQLCEDWAMSARQRLRVQIVRPFNQIGPGMPRGLLIPDVLQRVASHDGPLMMKGRDDWKDFLDWRDAMDAYMLLMRSEAASGSIWNLCSGQRTRVSSLIRNILVEQNVEREIRFADPRVETLIGDPSKLMRATGWAPRRGLRKRPLAPSAHTRPRWTSHDQDRTDHRRHRAGRQLPRRAAAGQELPGARHRTPGQPVQHRSH
jgi:nucleoside-diphosphate-sugar epimerase